MCSYVRLVANEYPEPASTFKAKRQQEIAQARSFANLLSE